MKAISCIYNLCCDSPFPFHKKPNPPSFLHSDISIFRYFYISIFPYLYILIFLYFYISVSLYLDISIFPYLYIFIFLYLSIYISISSHPPQKKPPSKSSTLYTLPLSQAAEKPGRRLFRYPSVRLFAYTPYDMAGHCTKSYHPKNKKQAMSVRSIRRVREPSEHGYGKAGVRVSPQPPSHSFTPCTTPPSML